MNKLFLLFFFLSLFFTQAQIVNVPSSSFLEHLTNCNSVDSNGDGVYDSNADLNNDGLIQVSEAENVLHLDVSHTGTSGCGIGVINDLTGLEAFVNLITFKCTGNGTFLTNIDLSANIALEKLDLSSNSLTSLDLSQNLNLIELICTANDLSTIDLSNNLDLEKLNCSWNFNITDIDLNANLNLEELIIAGTSMSNLDISLNTNLLFLNCSSNYLFSEIDVSSNILLESLIFNSNQSIDNIDISNNISLKSIDFALTGIVSIDLSNNTLLEEIDCSNNNQIINLDISNNSNLINIIASYTSISEIDLSHLQNLYFVTLSDNPNLTYVNIKNGMNDFAYNNNWTYLDLWYVPNLEVICVDDANSNFSWILQSNHPSTLITDNCALGLDEYNLSNLKVYPNPMIDYFKIENLNSIKIKKIELYNISGKKLKEYSISEKYDINDLSKGVYFVKIITQQSETNRKLIKI